MSRVFWDTNLFVYLFEDYGRDSEKVVALRRKMLERNDELVTSAMTIGEILVKPTSVSDDELCRNYEDAIRATAIIVNFDVAVARIYAKLSAQRRPRKTHRRTPFSWHVRRLRELTSSSPTTSICTDSMWMEFTSLHLWTARRY